MTATERLRAMLDERGVEYYPKRPDITVWSEGVWHIHAQEDMIEGMLELFVRPVTPEQAIEATLGRGECRDTGNYISAFECDACGEVYEMYRAPSFCPSCGKAVRA